MIVPLPAVLFVVFLLGMVAGFVLAVVLAANAGRTKPTPRS